MHNWDYKIRVEPWTVFAHVTVKLHGVKMQIDHIYGGKGQVGGDHTTVELNALIGGGGCENCFEISGTGQPSGDPELSCSGLLTQDELSSCDLGVQFHIVSLMRPGEDGGGEDGAFNAQAHVTTWVEPTDVTLSFDRELILRDVWNAFIVDGGVQSRMVVLRLKKQVGSWYGERKQSFGFSADGSIGRLPKISCKTKAPLPTPPPPSPPTPPPAVPPYYGLAARVLPGRRRRVYARAQPRPGQRVDAPVDGLGEAAAVDRRHGDRPRL